MAELMYQTVTGAAGGAAGPGRLGRGPGLRLLQCYQGQVAAAAAGGPHRFTLAAESAAVLLMSQSSSRFVGSCHWRARRSDGAAAAGRRRQTGPGDCDGEIQLTGSPTVTAHCARCSQSLAAASCRSGCSAVAT
jgi:hypothetical protein